MGLMLAMRPLWEDYIAPGIIGYKCHKSLPQWVMDCDHVALEVQNVIEDLVVVFDCIRLSGIVIDEVH